MMRRPLFTPETSRFGRHRPTCRRDRWRPPSPAFPGCRRKRPGRALPVRDVDDTQPARHRRVGYRSRSTGHTRHRFPGVVVEAELRRACRVRDVTTPGRRRSIGDIGVQVPGLPATPRPGISRFRHQPILAAPPDPRYPNGAGRPDRSRKPYIACHATPYGAAN